MIQLKDISAGYQGKTVVKNITLDFIPGQVTVLLGPNGCGKSTLLKAALGLIPTQNGKILYEDVDIKSMKRKEIAQKAAFLTQSRNVSSIQAFRMVLHGRFPYLSYPRHYGKQDYEIAREAMKMTGCLSYENENISKLSGGQRQSVYLAMALAQDTQTIFMDEPTTFLDINRQLQIMQIARELADQGKAVVLVLHDLSLALREADKIAVLQNGQLQCCGLPDEIYRSKVLEKVFNVEIYNVETPHGTQYYYCRSDEAALCSPEC